MPYALGLDYGTNSCRALIVDLEAGEEVGTSVFEYPSGERGVLTDAADPHLARQHPGDYLLGLERAIRGAIDAAKTTRPAFDPAEVIGIGIDTTGSTVIPVDREGTPLALLPAFRDNLHAQTWLWKDHTAHEEAAAITERAKATRPRYLARCGGTYS